MSEIHTTARRGGNQRVAAKGYVSVSDGCHAANAGYRPESVSGCVVQPGLRGDAPEGLNADERKKKKRSLFSSQHKPPRTSSASTV